MLTFKITLSSDTGKHTIIIQNSSKHGAILTTMRAYNCPLYAIQRIDLLTTRMTKKECVKYFLEYFNKFLTINKFAEYYDITELEAEKLINKGRI